MADNAEIFQTAVKDAAAFFTAGEMKAAEARYRVALECAPGHPVVLHNLGVAVAAQGDHQGAIDCFDQALVADGRYVSAYYNRAVALLALGRRPEAIRAFGQVIAINPDHYAAHRALGLCWLAEDKRGRALDHFARTYDLRRGEQNTGMALDSLRYSNRTKLLHDAGLFRYLADISKGPNRFASLAEDYVTVAEGFSEFVSKLSPDDFDLIGYDYNTAIHISPAPEVQGGAVSWRLDKERILEELDRDGAVSFDDLLTPAALDQLRRFLLGSTVWHDFRHIDGLVASYLEDGLACPVLLQIVSEIRQCFPEILAEHPLSQAWAFKGVTDSALIDVHADDAVFSINFWITPTESNADPGSGGMGICLTPPPENWEITDYDRGKEAAVQFLGQHRDTVKMIPYRANRAVLFKSRLLHFSDSPKFKQGYENARINVTLLFGVVSK